MSWYCFFLLNVIEELQTRGDDLLDCLHGRWEDLVGNDLVWLSVQALFQAMTGTFKSCAEANTAFNMMKSAMLKWPTAFPSFCACCKISFKTNT
jgi:hypothetical protein